MTDPRPLNAEEEAAVRTDVARRMKLALVYASVGGGDDVFALARLLATLDAARTPADPETLRAAAQAARDFVEWWDSPPFVIADDDVLEARVNALRAALAPKDPT